MNTVINRLYQTYFINTTMHKEQYLEEGYSFVALIANQMLVDILKRRRVRALFKQFKNSWI